MVDGKIDDKKPNVVMDTSEFFQVTKNKLGYRLREVLSGKSRPIRQKDPEGNDVVVKAYEFDLSKLRRVAKKYGFEFVTKLPSLPSSESAKTIENNGKTDVLTPLEVSKVSNLVTTEDLISVHWSEDFGKRPCGVCGCLKPTAWQADTNKDEHIAICEDCKDAFEKGREVS